MVLILTHPDCDYMSVIKPKKENKDNITVSLAISGQDCFNSLYIESTFDTQGNLIDNHAMGQSVCYLEDLNKWLNSPIERIEF